MNKRPPTPKVGEGSPLPPASRLSRGPAHTMKVGEGSALPPATQRKPSIVHSDVAQLPEDLRRLVEQMLIEGGTFEDVVEAVNERGEEGVTLAAIQNFFRSNLPLQQQRVRRQVETAQALKAAIGKPRSAEAKLAEATFLTGYLRLSRGDSELNPKDAQRARLERENLRLKQQLLRLKVQKAHQDRNLNRARIRFELAKWRLAKTRLAQLRLRLKETGQDQKLGPETIQKIQEIYGLITEPFVPAQAQKQ